MSVTRTTSWVAFSFAVASAACVGNTAPKGWLPKPVEAQSAAYGGWIELTYQGENEKRRSEGELIAVSADSVWVLNEAQGSVVPTASVKNGKLTAYAAQKANFNNWVVLGVLSTLSNGGFLIFTAPMWIIGGSITVGNETRAPVRKSPPLAWVELAPFARFPQGMPEGIELTALRPKKSSPPESH